MRKLSLTTPVFLPYHSADCPVSSVINSDPTLAEVAADFLVSLAQEDREKTQEEAYRFIRWLGLRRKARELTPSDVASYARQISPAEGRSVKSFLRYIYKSGITPANLAVHLRVKKTTRKTATPARQNAKASAALTTRGYARLEKELSNLKSQRSRVTQEMRKAAADKDFRENAPLKAAREHKSHLEGRIQELESTLSSATVINTNQDTSVVKIGDTVTFHDISSGSQLCYTLVDPREANPIKSRISIASPIGKALLDKEKGETIKVRAPAGVFSYRIEDIQHRDQ